MSFSSAQIVKASIKAFPHCLHYHVTGLCFWVSCHLGICTPYTTLELRHYLPDTVVTVFSDKDSNPWPAARVFDKASKSLESHIVQAVTHQIAGFGQQGDSPNHLSQNIRFKEVDILGNPADVFFGKGWLLSPTTTPYFPYFLSMLDALSWRVNTEVLNPKSWIPKLYDIGNWPEYTWGPLYPRNGFLMSHNDAKVAAVIAMRAANIVTHGYQVHVYKPTSNSCGTHCSVSTVNVNDSHTRWQMVYPIENNECTHFAEKNDASQLHPWGYKAIQKSKGDYVWVLWREYSGCVQGDGRLVAST